MTKANFAANSVDPASVPYRTLSSGARIPAVGLGTFGSDHVPAAEIAAAVADAISAGYRHIDCASVYRNEAEIGASLAGVLKAGAVKREDLWITSKLWNDKHGEDDVVPACRQSLADLQLDYLDLYLVHWPFPASHAPGVDVGSRDPHAGPYIQENFMRTWRQMERLVDLGLVRHIGTSNMTVPKLTRIISDARIKPACDESEMHPHFQQSEIFSFLLDNKIVPIAHCPIGSPARPERDRTPDDSVDIEDPVIVRIADRLGIHPATVCVKWAVQRGQVVVPFSTKRRNYLANLQATTTTPLTDQDMRDISAIDRRCRLIKGQVFLWKDEQAWEDLWDIDGVITPA